MCFFPQCILVARKTVEECNLANHFPRLLDNGSLWTSFMFILVVKQMLKTENDTCFLLSRFKNGNGLKRCWMSDMPPQGCIIPGLTIVFCATKNKLKFASPKIRVFPDIWESFPTSILPMIHHPRHYSPWIIHREWVNRDLSSHLVRQWDNFTYIGIGRRAFGKHKPIID